MTRGDDPSVAAGDDGWRDWGGSGWSIPLGGLCSTPPWGFRVMELVHAGQGAGG